MRQNEKILSEEIDMPMPHVLHLLQSEKIREKGVVSGLNHNFVELDGPRMIPGESYTIEILHRVTDYRFWNF